jgi:hypothetical protein
MYAPLSRTVPIPLARYLIFRNSQCDKYGDKKYTAKNAPETRLLTAANVPDSQAISRTGKQKTKKSKKPDFLDTLHGRLPIKPYLA